MRRLSTAELKNERGAILVQIAVAMVGLLSFSALVLDYGVLWIARRQAQTTADAAALAGAISMLHYPGDYDKARAAAKGVGETNKVFGLAPTINLGSGDSVDETEDISFPLCPPGPGAGEKACIRVNVYRNESRDPLPTFFAHLFGRTEQGVKATATAQIGSGNTVRCLLPFGVIDRWADNFDDNINTTYFANDGASGTTGWTPNDDFQPTASPADVYIPPYSGNPDTTGWTVEKDYGRQLIIKNGSPGGNGAKNNGDNTYSTGWSQLVYLPGSKPKDDILTCNPNPVGIATAADQCPDAGVTDPAKGCLDVKDGDVQVIAKEITDLVKEDPDAHWDPSAIGPDGQVGLVVGGQGMSSPRIRPVPIVDINAYISQNLPKTTCTGSTCAAKIANIIGFFVEGVCKDVTLDPGQVCDDPNKQIVGRIVTLPGSYATGVGSVQNPASFVEIVRLVR